MAPGALLCLQGSNPPVVSAACGKTAMEIICVGLLLAQTMAQARTAILATDSQSATGLRHAGRREPSQTVLLLCAPMPILPLGKELQPETVAQPSMSSTSRRLGEKRQMGT